MPTHDTTTGTPPMIGRCLSTHEWLDYVAAYDFGPVPPSRVVLHHTWVPTLEQWTGLRSMQGMQRFYAGKGWTAAPHIYVGPDGIWLFTPMHTVGIHAGSGNSGRTNGKFWYSIGVEMVGNYDKVRPTGAVLEGTRAVLGGLSKRLGIAPRQLISFHRDYTDEKSCPGWAVTKDWVMAEIEGWLGAPPAAEQPRIYRVRVAVANVRSAPTTQIPALRQLRLNDQVEVIEIVSGELVSGDRRWAKLVGGGYIHRPLLEPAS